MKRSTRNLTKVLLIVCAVFCAALILLQLAPYWEYENAETNTTETISVFEYLALPSAHKPVTKVLGSGTNEVINSLATPFSIVLLLGGVSIMLIILKLNSLWVSVFPFVVGVGTLISYLTEPRWQLGGLYVVFVALSAALAVVATVCFSISLYSIKYWFKDPKQLANK